MQSKTKKKYRRCFLLCALMVLVNSLPMSVITTLLIIFIMRIWRLHTRNKNRLKLNNCIFLIAFVLYGSFYDWNIACLGIILCLYVLLYYWKQGAFRKEKRWILWIPEIIFMFQLCVSFWAIDRSANVAGIMRGVVILLWMHLCLQWDQNTRERLLYMIPDMGIFMVILGGIAAFFENTKGFFWRAERFGGFFQYANTCALFLLLGIIICCSEQPIENVYVSLKERCVIIGKVVVLILGILLTGGRSILLIGMFWGIIHSIRDKKFRKIFACVVIGTGIIMGTFYLLTGDGTQNISRIFTIMSSNSTLYGRLLYDLDGIAIMFGHPMGLGYLGYHYVQHAWQTGVYTVRFVHNDILQIGLDYGIIPMLLFLFYMAWQFVKGKQPKWEKEILAVIITASFVDFHMQYMMIVFILVLCFDLGALPIKLKKPERLENQIVFAVLMFGFIYCFIPYLAVYQGKYQRALQFIPGNTEALCMAMTDTSDKDVACDYADQILRHNPYVSDAYNVRAYAAAMDGDVESVLENQDEVLRLEKYDVERYRAYDSLLEQLEQRCREIGQNQTVQRLENKRTNIKEQLEDLREQTSSIAYKLRDVPKYTW